MRPTDIRHIHTLSDPRVHPDGRRVVVAVAHPDLDEDDTVSSLWLHDGEAFRPFTHGPHDTTPRWSPDGAWLAFLRKGPDDDDEPQVVVMAADGGEARAVTAFPLGARELQWAPDSARLAVVGAEWVEDLAGLDDEERARRPRRLTDLPYREDGRGWVADRNELVHVVTREGDVRRLTVGAARDQAVAWHPHGDRVAFISSRHPGAGIDGTTQPMVVAVDSGEVTAITDPGFWDWVGFEDDGTPLLAGLVHTADWPGNVRHWRVADDGLVDLAGPLDRATTGCGAEPVRVADGMLVGIEDAGAVRLVGIPGGGPVTTTGGVHDLVAGDRVVRAAHATPDATVDGSAGTIVAVVADPSSPGELFRVAPEGLEQLTSCNDDLAAAGLRPVERFEVARDDATLDAWAVLPDGPGPWPVLLSIHGGPTTQYEHAFFDEFQVYASAGYLVVGANPRGSSGRGRDWARAVVGAWTDPDSVDMLDLRAVVDAALARHDRADPDRIGIMGGSYGGFATARIIARDHRWASAVVERGLLAWPSFGGTSDIGPFFDRMFLGATLPDDWQALHAASPVSLVADVTTPTLVLHSTQDWRCPVEQAEQYFAGLLRAGVPTAFVRFPDEGHELSRSGSPRHRVERFDAILEWHGRHLGVPWEPSDLGDEGDDGA